VYLYGIRYRGNFGYGLWQQAVASRLDLDPDSYAAARLVMRSFRRDGGAPLGMTPTHLVVDPTNEAAARALLETQFAPGGGSNPNYHTAELLVVDWTSSNANLKALVLSAGTLSPAFDPVVTNYTVSVANSVSSITVTGIPAESGAGLSANSGAAQSLAVGANVITITVTAQNGAVKTYTVTVTRAASYGGTMKRLYNFLLPLLLWAPDGAGGGGAPPAEIPLEGWIKRLNEAEEKDRRAIVEELAGALGIKTGAAFKKLKEAGWDPKNNSETLNDDITPPAAGERPGHGTSALPDDTRQEPPANTGDPAAEGGPPGSGEPPPGNTPVKQKTSLAILRHKSPYPYYRRAGLLLTTQWKPCEVTEEQLAALQSDVWVEFQKPAEKDGNGE
jgi:hypothetical protein